jgi:FkbM family methyltransferase
MFSLSFTKEVIKQFIYYPAGILKLPHGLTATDQYFEKARIQKWRKHPITKKKLRYFTIMLHQGEYQGLSPHIGSDGLYEPAETSLIQKILRPNMTFVDVGANIGWYTLLAASKVGVKGRVISFEPEPLNNALLKQSIALNNFQNVILMQKCLSNCNGTTKLYLAGQNFGAHSIVRQTSTRPTDIDVETQKLDDVLTEIGINNVDILKIDVEGAEALVLEGSQQTIYRGVKHILFEWNLDEWQNKINFLRYIFDNYEMYQIINNPFLIRRITYEKLQKTKFLNLYLRLRLA